jgi:hypothetical protein
VITAATPIAAKRALRSSLQRSISSVTSSVLADRSGAIESDFNLECQLTTAFGRGRVTLSVYHFYTLVADASRERQHRWEARTTGYSYRIGDADGREILAYHWHPAGRSPEARPHLHLGVGAGALRGELQKAHIGTGFVTPVPLLSLLLESFAVRPHRGDWATVLASADRALASP